METFYQLRLTEMSNLENFVQSIGSPSEGCQLAHFITYFSKFDESLKEKSLKNIQLEILFPITYFKSHFLIGMLL